MSSVRIQLPDSSIKEFPEAPTVLEVAASIGSRLAKDTLGGQVNDNSEIIDLRERLKDGDRLKIVTSQSPEGLEVIRHSAAHVMAQAVQELWPDVKVTIGPVIASGFYYDFDSPRVFHPEDLQAIEKKMKQIIKRDLRIERETWSSSKACEVFGEMGESFKVEIIKDLEVDEVEIYRQGDQWFDLCRGPHIQRLGQIKAVKVMSLAGSYWRGDENNKQLQRVYATAFSSQAELDEHVRLLEEAKKRDHRKLGKDLGLFHFHPLSPGGPFFTDSGTQIYNQLQNFIRDQYEKNGYKEVITPQIFDVELFKQSGHYDNYVENMYFTQVDERDFSLKPMNCPGHCVLYGMEKKSYKDLPWRIADFGRLHRFERSGVMHGLTRVRTFCQDDAHIFCRLEQMQSEIRGFMTMLNQVYSQLGLNEYKIYLSTRPEKRMGSDEIWDQAEKALQSALEELKLDYEVNPGDGAFYGPKLDIMFVDALKRPWQLGTIQADFNLPEAFELSFTGEDNQAHRPVMLHRAILGSLERFIGVYLEHTGGHLPLWLAPTQVVVMNLTTDQEPYSEKVADELSAVGLRVRKDFRGEKLGYKIREAQLLKVPYMIVLGGKEEEQEKVSVRLRTGENKNFLDLEAVKNSLAREVAEKSIESFVKGSS